MNWCDVGSNQGRLQRLKVLIPHLEALCQNPTLRTLTLGQGLPPRMITQRKLPTLNFELLAEPSNSLVEQVLRRERVVFAGH